MKPKETNRRWNNLREQRLRRPNLESLDLSEVVRRHSDLDFSSSLVDEAFLFLFSLGWMQSWDKFIFHQSKMSYVSSDWVFLSLVKCLYAPSGEIRCYFLLEGF